MSAEVILTPRALQKLTARPMPKERVGNIKIRLFETNLWQHFRLLTNEMIVTKSGR